MSKQYYPIDYACTVIIVTLFIELKNNPLTNPRVSDKLVLPSFSTGDEVDERRQRVATDNRELKFEGDSSGENTFIYIYIHISMILRAMMEEIRDTRWAGI